MDLAVGPYAGLDDTHLAESLANAPRGGRRSTRKASITLASTWRGASQVWARTRSSISSAIPRRPGPPTASCAKDRPLANDFMSDADFEALLLTWFGNAARVLRPGGGFYIWGGFMNLPNYPPALKAVGLYFSQAVIWVTEHPVLTRKDFMTNHELAFYGWREGAAHRFLRSTERARCLAGQEGRPISASSYAGGSSRRMVAARSIPRSNETMTPIPVRSALATR